MSDKIRASLVWNYCLLRVKVGVVWWGVCYWWRSRAAPRWRDCLAPRDFLVTQHSPMSSYRVPGPASMWKFLIDGIKKSYLGIRGRHKCQPGAYRIRTSAFDVLAWKIFNKFGKTIALENFPLEKRWWKALKLLLNSVNVLTEVT